MTTATGSELIEGYLRTRRVRHFRGHNDGEFFFLLNTFHGRLHVHLEPCGPQARTAKITVSTARYYPVAQRPRVAALAEQWNRSDPRAVATVFGSSDPRLVGVVTESRYRDGGVEFGVFVDEAIQSAIELFGRMKASTGGQERSDVGIGTGGQERSDVGIGTGGQERSDVGIETGGHLLDAG
ncbi:hypothetical protein B1R94_16610 [Mycolicibacterium litorale]|nr:hypothetical protein B1R94_16610 [Mycolicibacterium litorale]